MSRFGRSIRLLLAVALWAFAVTTRAAEAAPATSASLVHDGQARCAIVAPKDDAALASIAGKLADYFEQQVGVRPPILTESDLKDTEPHDAWIVLDAGDTRPLLSKLAVKCDVPSDRVDAYHLKVAPHGAHQVVALAGRTSAGVKFAAYRLMEEMEIDHRDARVGPLDVRASPFFKTRSVSLFNIWRVPVEVIRQCNLESWPKEKVQQSIDTYDAFGFNAVETHDRFHEDFLKAVYGITRAEWREKVYALCDRAHKDGMTVFLRQWGNSVALPVKELKDGYTPFGFDNLAPDIPEERKRWETEIRDYTSKNYATHIDHLIGHWADAGGVHAGSNATVKDSMLLHNELVAAFRAINPKVDSTFNLWGMANPRGKRGWPGYEDHRSICDAGILPKDVAIAQTTRARSHAYSEKETADIVASGHPAAVWTWRRADTEVRFGDCGLRIRIHGVMGDYFHRLPDSARDLAWHNIERNHHGLANDVNYYIAGKLMWDPKTDVDAALARYCALVFGRANAPAMAEAFDVIEMARHVEKQVSDEMAAHPAEGARRARVALDAVAKIQLPADHHSRLSSVTSPQEMLDEVRGTLAVIAENGLIMAEQLPKLNALLSGGKTTDAHALAATLQSKADSWFGTIAGGVEGLWLKETLAAKLAAKESSTANGKEWFGFRTFNVDDLQQKDDRYTVSSTASEPGIAVLAMQPTAERHAQFHFQFNVSPTGKSKNGGFAFGESDKLNALVRCQAFIGGSFIRIRGDALIRPVRLEVKPMDSTKPIECAVSVDLDARRVKFTVGDASIEAELKDMKTVGWYGYIAENTATDFGKIDVVNAE